MSQPEKPDTPQNPSRRDFMTQVSVLGAGSALLRNTPLHQPWWTR